VSTTLQFDRRAVTLNETCRLLGLCRPVVRRLIDEGRLRAIRVSGRRWLVPLDAIEELLGPTSAPNREAS
jgi:excisionase family DNA binding protein